MDYVRWGRTTCPSGAQTVYKGRGQLISRIARRKKRHTAVTNVAKTVTHVAKIFYVLDVSYASTYIFRGDRSSNLQINLNVK